MSFFEDAYAGQPPWDIGRPQQAIANLYTSGQIVRGELLDGRCETGENAIFFAEKGLNVVGMDISQKAIDYTEKTIFETRFHKQGGKAYISSISKS